MQSNTTTQLNPFVEVLLSNCREIDHSQLSGSLDEQFLVLLAQRDCHPTPIQKKLMRGIVANERRQYKNSRSKDLAVKLGVSESCIASCCQLSEFVETLPLSVRLFFYRGEVNGVQPKAREVYRLLVDRPSGLTSIEAANICGNPSNLSRLLNELEHAGHAKKLPKRRGGAYVYVHRRYWENFTSENEIPITPKNAKKKKNRGGQFSIPDSQCGAFKRLNEIADELGPILKSPNRYQFNYPRFKRLGEEVFQIIKCFHEEGIER